MSLKLGPIPDRQPVKINLTIAPHVHDALTDYAKLHKQSYGQNASIAELAALMLEKFLDSDAQFKRARKSLRPIRAAKE